MDGVKDLAGLAAIAASTLTLVLGLHMISDFVDFLAFAGGFGAI